MEMMTTITAKAIGITLEMGAVVVGIAVILVIGRMVNVCMRMEAVTLSLKVLNRIRYVLVPPLAHIYCSPTICLAFML